MQPSCGEMGELSGSFLFAEPFAAPTHLYQEKIKKLSLHVGKNDLRR